MAQRMRNENAELTAAEIRVMKLVNKGLFNLEIAGTLGITYNTVRTHLQNILRKFGVNNRTEASYMFRNLFGKQLNEES